MPNVLTGAAVSARHGAWVTDGGDEYHLVLIAAVFALSGTGPGAWSLDDALGIDMSGAGWALLALAVGVAAGAATVSSAQARRAATRTRRGAHAAGG